MWSSESSVDVEQWQQRRRGSWQPTERRGSQMDLSLCEATAQSYLCAVSLDSDAEWLGYVSYDKDKLQSREDISTFFS